jgi:hypothetical protein
MTRFPLPPAGNRKAPAPAPETPPEIHTVSGKLSPDETQVILATTLREEHRDDPNVLRFIANYLRCRDARQAAREAGLDPRSGPNLRARPDVHQAIVALSEKSVMKYGFDAAEVIERVKEVASFDPAELLNEDGSYKTSLRDVSPEARRAIKKFKAKNLFEKDPNGMRVQVGVLLEVEIWDKMKASELLGREKEVFVEKKKIEHDMGSNMASLLLESKARAESRSVDAIESGAIEVLALPEPPAKTETP